MWDEKINQAIKRALDKGRVNPMEIEAWLGDFFKQQLLASIRKKLKDMEKQGVVTHKLETVTVPAYWAQVGERKKVLARKRRMSVYYPTEKYKGDC